jgi:uncharacterized protein YecE (DUF72 family)
MSASLHIGCSSWTSESWWGKLYSTDLPPGDRLAAYAKLFDVVEVDSSYYRDPGAFLVRRWARATPENFLFTMKFPRDLMDPKRPVDRDAIGDFESHARELGPKLAAVLLQFPPWFTPGRAGSFLDELLASVDPGLRYAVELREAGWFQGETLRGVTQRLHDLRFALAWSYLTYADVPPELTTDFVYLRFIGDHTTVPEERHGELRVDRRPATRLWAERLAAVRDRLENALAFFNNHFAGFAPASVNLFREELGLPPIPYELASAPARGPEPGRSATQTTLDGG